MNNFESNRLSKEKAEEEALAVREIAEVTGAADKDNRVEEGKLKPQNYKEAQKFLDELDGGMRKTIVEMTGIRAEWKTMMGPELFNLWRQVEEEIFMTKGEPEAIRALAELQQKDADPNADADTFVKEIGKIQARFQKNIEEGIRGDARIQKAFAGNEELLQRAIDKLETYEALSFQHMMGPGGSGF